MHGPTCIFWANLYLLGQPDTFLAYNCYSYFAVMELAKTDLYDALRSRVDQNKGWTKVGFTEDEARLLFRQIMRGLETMHRNLADGSCLVHRDIKLENVLLQDSTSPESTRVLLADFGFSIRQPANQKSEGIQGTAMYCAPEILSNEYDARASDIFACGVILYCLLAGKYPFANRRVDGPTQGERGRGLQGGHLPPPTLFYTCSGPHRIFILCAFLSS